VCLRTRIGELVFVRNAYAARTPSVVVALVEEALGVWRHEFTSVWRKSRTSGRTGAATVESLEDLKKALSAASDGAVVAALQRRRGFRHSD